MDRALPAPSRADPSRAAPARVRAAAAPELARSTVLRLQESVGNRRVVRLLQRAPSRTGIAEWPTKGATVDEAKRAAQALEAAAKANAAKAGFVPSWAVDAASQAGWRTAQVAQMSQTELKLIGDVMKAQEVIVGRSINVSGRGMFLLDEWLSANGIQWTQRWQDVYNKALYLRTSAGKSVQVMAGAGYSAGEVVAAEEGAAIGGVKNVPYWPDAAEQAAGKAEQVAAESAVASGAEGTLVRGLGSTVLEVAFNPALQFGYMAVKGIASDYQEAWRRIKDPARHVGFAQGWVACLVGLDRKWLRYNLAPRFVDRTDVAVEALGAAGMRENAYIRGMAEGFRYGEGYTIAWAKKPIDRAMTRLKARGETLAVDAEGAFTRNSIILLAAALQPDADRAIARWDGLRKQREEAAAAKADRERREQREVGHFI